MTTSLNSLHEQSGDSLLWVDCEFTGIDIKQGHKILEIGAIVTDLALREMGSFQSFINYEWSHVDSLMNTNPWWQDRHEDRARIREGIIEAPSVEEVDVLLSSFIAGYFPTSKPSLCGNTISNDKKHIDDQLIKTSEKLNYQVVDVSSFKIVGALYKGVSYNDKKHKHYAVDDIRESIDEFRFLLAELGIATLPKT